MSKETVSVISNALIAFGSVALSVGFALPFTALQVFIAYPDNPAAQVRANSYANFLNSATNYFLFTGGTIMLLGIFYGLSPSIKVSRTAWIKFGAACAFVAGGVLVYLAIIKPYYLSLLMPH